MKQNIILSIIIVLVPFLVTASDYYVDANYGSNENSGISKDDAWKTITHALLQVEETEENPITVHVASGRYNIDNGEIFPLVMQDNLTLSGAGRDDVIVESRSYKTDAPLIYAEDAHNFLIENLTLQASDGYIPVIEPNGGGVISIDSSFRIHNCLLQKMSRYEIEPDHFGRGAGLELDNSNVIVDGCLFRYTASYYCYGGSIYCIDSSVNIIGSDFIENSSPGIMSENSTLFIEDSYFNLNDIAGLFTIDSSTRISNSRVIYNSFWYGGRGGYFEGDGFLTVENSIFLDNNGDTGSGLNISRREQPADIVNCLFAGNSGYRGGALYIKDAPVNLINCTITGNISSKGCSIHLRDDAELTMINSIIWGNDDPEQIEGNINAYYCLIEGGFEGIGIIDEDPLFIPGPWGDYYLSLIESGQEADSPCINMGIESLPISGFDKNWTTTRTDGIFDTDTIGIGFHYPPSIQFELDIIPDKALFTEGDELKISAGVLTGTYSDSMVVDLYFILIDQSNFIKSYPDWSSKLYPAAANLPLPANLSLDDITLLDMTLPSESPYISSAGTYMFAIFATLPGTLESISNLASVSFEVE